MEKYLFHRSIKNVFRFVFQDLREQYLASYFLGFMVLELNTHVNKWINNKIFLGQENEQSESSYFKLYSSISQKHSELNKKWQFKNRYKVAEVEHICEIEKICNETIHAKIIDAYRSFKTNVTESKNIQKSIILV